MAEPANDIPAFERLLRNVTRLAMATEHGAGWLDDLDAATRAQVASTAALARRKRPDETLKDDFDAAGVPELKALLLGDGSRIVDQVWGNKDAARVDLDRLKAYRDKNLHAVGPPSGQVADDEIAAILTRLRVRLEAYRRGLLDSGGDWWPYVESVTSNVEQFCFERAGKQASKALLTEGDLVLLDVVGVNPNGRDDALLYRLMIDAAAGGGPHTITEWQRSRSFSFEVPRAPRMAALVLIKSDSDDHGETFRVEIDIRPLP